jgi:hypothetical protein
MGKVIGKVLATEKNPSTIEEFYFWTRPELILNPFDVVKVDHINDSVTYGVIEEISHITDTANFLSDYISNDFGEVSTTTITHRIGMNYVRVRIVGNNKNVYIPVINGQKVCIAEKAEISEALGLSTIKHPIPCGYLEMYKGTSDEEQVKLTVNVDSRYLIGPEGAHLNISGISGLAAKTSYAMFLLKAIQDKCLSAEDEEDDEDVAFVIFNVKGKDLLAIDEPNLFENEQEKNEVYATYKEMGLTTKPFKNVHYYYPYSDKNSSNTYLEKSTVEDNINRGVAHMYKYEYKQDKDNLDLMFASLDDPTQTMDAILNYIISGRGEFGHLDDWTDFIDEVHACGGAGQQNRDKEITVQSWRKFERIVKKSIYKNPIFDNIKDTSRETRISEALCRIQKNEVHVIDIAKLNDDMQCFVFGDTIRAIYDLKLGQYDDTDYTPPSKIVVFIDELNKYASSDAPKTSPILRQVLDIAERGRSLGVVLFGAEQFKSAIHPRVTGNCSTFAYGRTNAIEIAKNDYRFIPSVYKSMMSRLEQGEYIIQNPVFRSLLNVRFPKPIYKQFKSK